MRRWRGRRTERRRLIGRRRSPFVVASASFQFAGRAKSSSGTLRGCRSSAASPRRGPFARQQDTDSKTLRRRHRLHVVDLVRGGELRCSTPRGDPESTLSSCFRRPSRGARDVCESARRRRSRTATLTRIRGDDHLGRGDRVRAVVGVSPADRWTIVCLDDKRDPHLTVLPDDAHHDDRPMNRIVARHDWRHP